MSLSHIVTYQNIATLAPQQKVGHFMITLQKSFLNLLTSVMDMKWQF